MKKITKFYKAILPSMYLAPFILGAYAFVSFVQWTS